MPRGEDDADGEDGDQDGDAGDEDGVEDELAVLVVEAAGRLGFRNPPPGPKDLLRQRIEGELLHNNREEKWTDSEMYEYLARIERGDSRCGVS